MVKQRVRGVRTVIGGGVFFDDLAMGSDNLQTLLGEFPFIDHVVLGEGELLLRQLLEERFDNRRVLAITDLDGRTVDMQDVPDPAFGDFDLDRYFHLTLEGGRSCPFQCTFCSETVQWGTYRKKNKQLLAGQMLTLALRICR